MSLNINKTISKRKRKRNGSSVNVSHHPVHEYFTYEANNNSSLCNVDNCTTKMTGLHASNLQRHIRRSHPCLKAKLEEDVRIYNATKKKSTPTEQSEYVYVRIYRDEFIKGVLDLINVNCRPFSLFQDSGFKKIVNPILEQFEINKHPISLNRESLQKRSDAILSSKIEEIKAEMRDKLISLQIDLGTANDGREIFGVIAQYMVEGVLKVRTIAMKVFNDSTTGLKLAIAMKNILTTYGVSVDNVYAITSDNGKNMLSCIDIFKLFQSHQIDDYLDTDPEKIDYELLETLVKTQLNLIENWNQEYILHGIKCSAHTMQLSLKDIVKSIENEFVNECRAYARLLRTPTIKKLLKEKQLKQAIIDCVTRWNSTIAMVGKLFLIKTFFHCNSVYSWNDCLN